MCDDFSFKVSNCVWTLDVTVLVIDMKHAEKRNGQYCCCDVKENVCENSLNEPGMCEGNCDLLLNVTASRCTESTRTGPCSVFTDEIKDAKKFHGYYFIFHFTTTSQANNVSKCFVLCNMAII